MSDTYIRNILQGKDVSFFIDGFTFKEYLRFLEVYLDRPEYAADYNCYGVSLNSPNLPEHVCINVDFKDLPRDISSFPSFIRELIAGYEAITKEDMRAFMSLFITPEKVNGEIIFKAEVFAPSLNEELDFDKPDEVECKEPINQLLKEMNSRIDALGNNSFNNLPSVEISRGEFHSLFNALAYRKVKVTTVQSQTLYFKPDA